MLKKYSGFFRSDAVDYLTFSATALTAMATVERRLNSDVAGIFREFSSMRQFHASNILGIEFEEDSNHNRPFWNYPFHFLVIAWNGMECEKIPRGLKSLVEMDSSLCSIEARPARPEHAAVFDNARKSLLAQMPVLRHIISRIENPPEKPQSYICRICGWSFDGILRWNEDEETTCECCGAGAGAFRALRNWMLS